MVRSSGFWVLGPESRLRFSQSCNVFWLLLTAYGLLCVVLEAKIQDVNELADMEQKIISEWRQSESGKLERQISWLARQCEEFIQASGDKTIQLPHGRLSLRAGKANVSVVDEAAFMKIAEKKGLVRIKPAKKLPDLLKIHEYIRQHGFPRQDVPAHRLLRTFHSKRRIENKMSNNRPKLELQLNQPIKLKLLRDLPLVGENGHGKYTMYAIQDESGEEHVWFAPSTAHDVIQSQQLKAGSEIVAKFTGKNKVEVSTPGKAVDPEHMSKSADNLAEILKQSIADAVQAIRSFPDIPFQSEDIRAAALTILIQRAKNA